MNTTAAPTANVALVAQPEPVAQPGSLRWPMIVVGLLIGQAFLCLVGVLAATRDRSFAVETDYHRKAVEWDALVARQRASQLLGWKSELRVETRPDKRHELILTLRDESGHPIPSAGVNLQYFHHARATQVRTAELAALGTGEYRLPEPLDCEGVWEFRVLARDGGAVFTDRVRADLEWNAPVRLLK